MMQRYPFWSPVGTFLDIVRPFSVPTEYFNVRGGNACPSNLRHSDIRNGARVQFSTLFSHVYLTYSCSKIIHSENRSDIKAITSPGQLSRHLSNLEETSVTVDRLDHQTRFSVKYMEGYEHREDQRGLYDRVIIGHANNTIENECPTKQPGERLCWKMRR
jgi:hypothetical protein